jgi:HNH endonuclease
MSTGRPPSLTPECLDVKNIFARLLIGRHIDAATGCWNWQRCRNSAGYGVMKLGGRQGWIDRVHRLSFALHKGPVGPGDCVLHRCDNPPCFNPDHLFLGTKADNTKDMMAKGRSRTRPLVGEQSTNAILTERGVLDILARLKTGERESYLAREFGVTQSAIHLIRKKKNWKHLSQEESHV